MDKTAEEFLGESTALGEVLGAQTSADPECFLQNYVVNNPAS